MNCRGEVVEDAQNILLASVCSRPNSAWGGPALAVPSVQEGAGRLLEAVEVVKAIEDVIGTMDGYGDRAPLTTKNPRLLTRWLFEATSVTGVHVTRHLR